MINKLLFKKENLRGIPNKFHEMREKECDDTAGKAFRFVKEQKKFRGIH
jgi:hypothetical protein